MDTVRRGRDQAIGGGPRHARGSGGIPRGSPAPTLGTGMPALRGGRTEAGSDYANAGSTPMDSYAAATRPRLRGSPDRFVMVRFMT